MSYSEQEVEQVLKNHIAAEFMASHPGVTLDNDLSLIDEGIIDSLGIFMLISFIGDQFKVQIEPNEVVLENFETIDTIKGLVMAKL